jgi:NhaA family Na+:H+ antiporter
MAICALAVTAMLAHREFFPPDPSALAPPVKVKEWKQFDVGNMRIGPNTAAVKIIEFSDFQCPFCAKLAGLLDEVIAKHPHDVQVVFRNFPLEAIHPHARFAALAAQCAAIQGRFKEYHSFLFNHQDSLGTTPWVVVAERAAVPDTGAFSSCLQSSRSMLQLKADVAAGEALSVNSTPAFLVNRFLVRGVPTALVLEKLIAQELADTKTE